MTTAPPECRLLRPAPAEFFKTPSIVAALDSRRNIVFFRKDIWDLLPNEKRNRIIFLRDPVLSLLDATR